MRVIKQQFERFLMMKPVQLLIIVFALGYMILKNVYPYEITLGITLINLVITVLELEVIRVFTAKIIGLGLHPFLQLLLIAVIIVLVWANPTLTIVEVVACGAALGAIIIF